MIGPGSPLGAPAPDRNEVGRTAVAVETHDEWQVAERRYLSETSMALTRRNEARAKQTTRPPRRRALAS